MSNSGNREPVVIDIITEPKCLISTGVEGDEVNNEEDVLKALAKRDKPAVVVGIAGKYRSGKSYLMNRLAGKKGGFSLESTIRSHTKGIWIWVMDHPKKPNQDLILLDTEGLGDVEKSNEDHDSWIFCLTLLLSSTLIFNVMGVLDKANIDMLNLIIELSKRIKTKDERRQGEDLDFDAYCPNFVMVHRDFTQELKIDGKELTPDGYLDHCLKVKPSDKDKKVSKAKLHVRKYFKRRSCYVFGPPAGRKKIPILETLPDDQIEEDFVDESARLINFILNECDVKSLQNSKPVNGRILAKMVRIYIESIKRGDVPCIEGAVDIIAIEEDQRVIDEAIKIFQDRVKEIQLPKEENDMQETVGHARKSALEHFGKHVIRDQNDKMVKRFMASLEYEIGILREENMKISEENCKAVLEELNKSIESKVKSNSYFKIGGHSEYVKDERELERKYKLEKGLGEMKLQALTEFLNSKELLANTIKKIDESEQAASQLAKDKDELKEAVRETGKIIEKMQENMDRTLKNTENEQCLMTMAHSEELEKMKQQMKALEKERDRKIQEIQEEMLQQQKMKDEKVLIGDLQRSLKESLQRDEARQEALNDMREVEISKQEIEGLKQPAAQLQKEKDQLDKEFEKEKEKKNSFCSLM